MSCPLTTYEKNEKILERFSLSKVIRYLNNVDTPDLSLPTFLHNDLLCRREHVVIH